MIDHDDLDIGGTRIHQMLTQLPREALSATVRAVEVVGRVCGL